MKKPLTLLILAAGMGSRYGGTKQIDGIGKNNEAIIDYSIYDAIRSSITKIVFVIRKNFEKNFKKAIIDKIPSSIETVCVYQELSDLPEGFSLPENREKPWGTAHAVMAAAKVINEPFIVINADDFYGMNSFKIASEFLLGNEKSKLNFALVGFKLKNTLSEFGYVSRGICQINHDNFIRTITERTKIKRENNQYFYEENESKFPLTGNEIVSMNMFAFTPDILDYFKKYFISFLNENIQNPKAEFYLPTVVNNLITENIANVKVLQTNENWFGLTYKEDKDTVQNKISNLIKEKKYPVKLWNKNV